MWDWCLWHHQGQQGGWYWNNVTQFVDNNGNHVYLPCVSYHLPTMDVRLFSPQIYHQLHGGHSVVNGNEVVMKFCKKEALISIPIDRNATNLPLCTILSCPRRSWESMPPSSGLLFMRLGFMQHLTTLPTCQSTKICQPRRGNRIPFPASQFPCVGGLKNENLLMPQKELLLWH